MSPPESPAHFQTNWSALNVEGPDAAAFLHNLSTNDIKRLADGDACETLFTDVKAHVLAHAIVCRAGDSLQVVVTSSAANELAEHLDRYHITEKLELRPVENFTACVCFGPQPAAQTVYPLRGLADEERPNAWLAIKDSSDLTGQPMSDVEFHVRRIQHRFPLDRIDCDERNLPQELNRDAALISFTKGCYLGQETVARIDALGRVNQLLVGLEFEGTLPEPGEELLVAEKVIGRITSVAQLSEAIGLAYVRREHVKPGTSLQTPSGTAKVS